MKKIIFILIASYFSFFSSVHSETFLSDPSKKSLEYQWDVKSLGTPTFFKEAHAIDFNDGGQALIEGITTDEIGFQKKHRGIGNAEIGFFKLPQIPCRTGRADSEVIWLKINQDDTAIGIQNFDAGGVKPDGFVPKLILWNKSTGLKSYNFDPSIKFPGPLIGLDAPTMHDRISIAQCGSSNHVVASVSGKIFMLQNNALIDISSILAKQSNKDVLNCYYISWKALAIDVNGNIFGLIECFSKHPFREEKILQSRKFFYWNGETTKFIDIPKDALLPQHRFLSSYYLNDKGKVSFYWHLNGENKPFIWNAVTDSLELKKDTFKFKNQNLKCHITAILNDNTIIWRSFQSPTFVIFQNEENLSLVDLGDLKMNIEASLSIKFSYFHSVNNNKQLIIDGAFLGETHPFLTNPLN